MSLGKRGAVESFAMYLILMLVVITFLGLSFVFLWQAQDEKRESYLFDLSLLDMSLFSRNLLSLEVENVLFSKIVEEAALSEDCDLFERSSALALEQAISLDDEWFTYFRYVDEEGIRVSCLASNFREDYKFNILYANNEDFSIQNFRPVILPVQGAGLIYFAAFDSRFKNFEPGQLSLRFVLDRQFEEGYIS